MENENAQPLNQAVNERLDKFDWDDIKAKVGITRDWVEKNPKIARQMAFENITSAVPSRGVVSGTVFLRIYHYAEGQPWQIKPLTKNSQKLDPENLSFMGGQITSETAIKRLFEKAEWDITDRDGNQKTVRGQACANAGVVIAIAPVKRDENGKPISYEKNGKTVYEHENKKYYLVSLHGESGYLVGQQVGEEKVKGEGMVPTFNLAEYLGNGNGLYGVRLNNLQAKRLAEGGFAQLEGCKNSNGESFSCLVQFDACKMAVVPVHPSLSEKERKYIENDLRNGEVIANKVAKGEKAAVKVEKTPKVAAKPANRPKVSRSR